MLTSYTLLAKINGDCIKLKVTEKNNIPYYYFIERDKIIFRDNTMKLKMMACLKPGNAETIFCISRIIIF
jgi:hypothetical protein